MSSNFRNSAMFIQPMFDYKPDLWIAMLYGHPHPDYINENSKFMIGFAFTDKVYAEEFFDLMRGYNHGENEDKDDNIKLSFITESPEEYSVYIYPSFERENLQEFYKEAQDEYGKDTGMLIAQLTINKYFPYGEGSAFKTFKELYSEGQEVELKAFHMKDKASRPEELDIEPIKKNDMKIKHRKLLNKDEHEYQHHKSMKK